MLDKAKELNWLQGFDVGSRTDQLTSVSHLLVAEGTLIICGAEGSQVQYLNINLMLFEALWFPYQHV